MQLTIVVTISKLNADLIQIEAKSTSKSGDKFEASNEHPLLIDPNLLIKNVAVAALVHCLHTTRISL
jgi:hypothetical protein